MLGYLMEFNTLPSIGFALHCKIPQYKQFFDPDSEGIEIAYVKKGTIVVEIYGRQWHASPGSIIVIMRNLPFLLYSKNNETSEHSTIQLLADFKIKTVDDINTDFITDKDALAVPLIIAPCSQNEAIMKKIYSVISDSGDFLGSSRMSRTLTASSLLNDINHVWKTQKNTNDKTPSILSYKVKKLILTSSEQDITLRSLAEQLGKTPNYLNHVFKEETGITIHQYIIKEKIQLICELILNKALPFKDACMTVGIQDISYGYRLFKRQTGLTPGEFIKGATHRK